MSTPSPAPKKRTVLWRRIFQIEQALVTIGLVVYALLVSINQRASLFIILVATLTVGNLVIPLVFAGRRLYAARPFPWNWVAFFPVQIVFGVICAAASILFLQITRIDAEPFSDLFAKIGYLCIVVVVIANSIGFGIEQLQRKLKERNQLLEQTVEKGAIALQQQEDELKRAREIQQMLLPSTLPQPAGVQIAGAWQPAREVGEDLVQQSDPSSSARRELYLASPGAGSHRPRSGGLRRPGGTLRMAKTCGAQCWTREIFRRFTSLSSSPEMSDRGRLKTAILLERGL